MLKASTGCLKREVWKKGERKVLSYSPHAGEKYHDGQRDEMSDGRLAVIIMDKRM